MQREGVAVVIVKVKRPSMDLLKEMINDDQGLTQVSMRWLREAAGWEKLGKHVVADIATQLENHRIGYLGELGLSQDIAVRVFDMDHPIGDLIAAVRTPTPKGDERLREAASNDAAEILSRIRSMVCTDD